MFRTRIVLITFHYRNGDETVEGFHSLSRYMRRGQFKNFVQQFIQSMVKEYPNTIIDDIKILTNDSINRITNKIIFNYFYLEYYTFSFLYHFNNFMGF